MNSNDTVYSSFQRHTINNNGIARLHVVIYGILRFFLSVKHLRSNDLIHMRKKARARTHTRFQPYFMQYDAVEFLFLLTSFVLISSELNREAKRAR